MKSNTVKITFTDDDGIILAQHNTTDDWDLCFELLDKLGSHLTPAVTIALEVAMEEMELQAIQDEAEADLQKQLEGETN